MEPRFSKDNFRHRFAYRVRSHECDRQGIVHNARYLEMLEIARIEYSRDVLRIPMDTATFVSHDKFVFVRNVMDYYLPAQFDQILTIWTRVSKTGRTSVTFEQFIEHSGNIVLEAEAVMVSLDILTNQPIELRQDYIERARMFEQGQAT